MWLSWSGSAGSPRQVDSRVIQRLLAAKSMRRCYHLCITKVRGYFRMSSAPSSVNLS
jgi:hypothetical protein